MRHIKNIVGPQVRNLRKQRNWTHHQLAVELARRGMFISAKVLVRIELQREFVGTFELSALAAVFQVSADDLFPPEILTTGPKEILHVLQKHGVLDRPPVNDERQRAN